MNNSKNRKRKRKIIWFNPPYSKSVVSNIGKYFFNCLSSELPRGHKMCKLFNQNTVKSGYCCNQNIKTINNGHNRNISTPIVSPSKKCNCRIKHQCPLNGDCLSENVICKATVKAEENNRPTETYVGLTETTIKQHYANHLSTFKHHSKKNSTELSKHFWRIKDSKTRYTIDWSI